jgi:hypothetical protein
VARWRVGSPVELSWFIREVGDRWIVSELDDGARVASWPADDGWTRRILFGSGEIEENRLKPAKQSAMSWIYKLPPDWQFEPTLGAHVKRVLDGGRGIFEVRKSGDWRYELFDDRPVLSIRYKRLTDKTFLWMPGMVAEKEVNRIALASIHWDRAEQTVIRLFDMFSRPWREAGPGRLSGQTVGGTRWRFELNVEVDRQDRVLLSLADTALLAVLWRGEPLDHLLGGVMLAIFLSKLAWPLLPMLSRSARHLFLKAA